MSSENDLRMQHEPLANQYLLSMDSQELIELATCLGLKPDSMWRRALALRSERFHQQQGNWRESTK